MPIEHRSYPFNPLTADAVGTRIEIGPETHAVEVPRVDAALADELVVDEANPWYSTDGACLFSKDGATLLRCLTRIARYEVPSTCSRIEQEAFAYNTVIRQVSFPDTLTSIGDRAFISSTLDYVELPGSVRVVGEDAFAEGKNLRYAKLGEGIEELLDGAFSDCEALEHVNVPASVARLGKNVFARCAAKAHGENPGLVIAPGNERYFIDGAGVLYGKDEDGLTLVEALDQLEGDYVVHDGTVRIMGRAFAFNRKLQSIAFPDTLLVIGKRAFLECERLVRADLPPHLREIRAEAFYHTALASMTIPASLEELGPASLIVSISIASQSPQTGVGGRGASDFYHTALSGRLHEVTVPRFDISVADGNPRYTLDEGFLCDHDPESGVLRAVQFVGGGTAVTVPRNVTNIADYALFGVENIRELHLHTGIQSVGHSALSLSYPLDLIEIDDGNDIPVLLYPAPNSSGTMAQRKAFRTGRFEVDQLVRDCDSSLSFMMPGTERSCRMLRRLANGRRLSDVRMREFTTTVRISTDELVRHFAQLDDRQGIRDLLDLGFIDGESIAHAIELANSVKGIACARLLLEERRSRFSNSTFDFGL